MMTESHYKTIEIPALYTSAGYLNMDTILSLDYPFTVIITLRGGGKTYGCLKYMLDHDQRFLYFRRTKNAAELCCSPAYSVFNKINSDLGIDVRPQFQKQLGVGSFILDEKPIGLCASLSTFASVRSIDGSSLDWIILDEFIPEASERQTYDLFNAWANADETINRNREIDGGKGARRLLMANADLIYGSIVAGYGIGDAFLWMQETGTEAVEFSQDMLLIRPQMEDLKRKKENTPLYRVTRGSDFSDVALENKFKIEDREKIRNMPHSEYIPVAGIMGMYFYKHKSRREFYVSGRMHGAPKLYQNTETDKKRFFQDNRRIWEYYLKKKVYFESLNIQTRFLQLFT